MTMTAFEREGLHLLGYTRRESEFLFLVATHSGYFTNRQFKAFAQTESGSVSHSFIRKLLDRKHASFHTYRSGGRVYHLFARKVYLAIGRENLRTRKKHELYYVKTRLVALDFVIGHPEHHYLETEAEKIAFFEKEWNLSREILPVKQYRARKSADITPRYFVDRFPMFVNRVALPSDITFTYVEAGAVTLEAFGTHLRAYLPLFQALPQLEFIYVAPTTRLFKMAESEFHRLLCGVRNNGKSANLLHYFRVRKAWEAKERVTSADVVLLKESQARHASREVQELYEKWRSCAIADAEVTRLSDEGNPSVRRVFRAMICGSSLSVFTDPRSHSAENCSENTTTVDLPHISESRSSQISGT
jgi:hypothetical protein